MSLESEKWYRIMQPVFNSGFEDNEFWAYGRDGFQEQLNSFIGTDVLIYEKTIMKHPRKVRAIVQQKTSDTFSGTTLRQILCNIGTLRCGQYVKYDGMLWLVSSLPDNNRIYEKAVLWKCQHNIRFLSPLTGKIVEYPTYGTNSTQYGTGIAEEKQMDVGEDQHLIYLPYNRETVLLDDDFRFIMDKNRSHPTVYKITRVDTVSYAVGSERENDGLIQWSVLEDQFNEETDSRKFMVADYHRAKSGGTETADGNQANLILADLDGDFQIALGEEKQIQVQCKALDGTEISDFQYRLEYDFSDGIAEITDEADNIITIKAARHPYFVGRYIEIRVISDDLQSEATIRIQVVNW